MVREYTECHYLPAAAAYHRRAADRGRLAAVIEAWRQRLAADWPRLRFGPTSVTRSGSRLRFAVQVHLGNLEAADVRVELYADPPQEGSASTRIAMQRVRPLEGAAQAFLYTATVDTERPGGDFTPRVVPVHAEAEVPLEAGNITWQR
jgi:starch phosphorylase